MALIRTAKAGANKLDFTFGAFTHVASTTVSFSVTQGKTYFVTGYTPSSSSAFITGLTGGVIDSQFAITDNSIAGAFITASGSTIAFTSDRYVDWCEVQ